MDINVVPLCLELIRTVMSYAAPAAFIWLISAKCARAIIRVASGYTKEVL